MVTQNNIRPRQHLANVSRLKLTAEAVHSIRASREMGKVLAIDFGVSPSTITQVRKGRRWGWLV